MIAFVLTLYIFGLYSFWFSCFFFPSPSIEFYEFEVPGRLFHGYGPASIPWILNVRCIRVYWKPIVVIGQNECILYSFSVSKQFFWTIVDFGLEKLNRSENIQREKKNEEINLCDFWLNAQHVAACNENSIVSRTFNGYSNWLATFREAQCNSIKVFMVFFFLVFFRKFECKRPKWKISSENIKLGWILISGTE